MFPVPLPVRQCREAISVNLSRPVAAPQSAYHLTLTTVCIGGYIQMLSVAELRSLWLTALGIANDHPLDGREAVDCGGEL
jgi:hypothetical protein